MIPALAGLLVARFVVGLLVWPLRFLLRHRALLAVAVVGLAVVVLVPRADAAPVPAQLPGLPSPCDLAPAGILKDACNAVGNPVGAGAAAAGAIAAGGVGAATNAVGQAVTSFSNPLLDGALQWFAALLSDTTKAALDQLGAAMGDAPKAPLDAAWFHDTYAPLAIAGCALCFFVFLAHIAAAAVRGRPVAVWWATRNAMLAVWLTVIAPLLIQMLVTFADAFTSGFAAWGGQSAGQLIDKMTEITSTVTLTGALNDAKPLFVILALFVAVCVSLVWMLLLAIRSEIVFLGTLAIPFVLPAIIGGRARLARFYFKTLIAVIFMAPVLFGVVCMGAVLFRNGYVNQAGLWPIMTGIGLMLTAVFAPFFVMRLLIPAAAPGVWAVQRGGRKVVHTVRDGHHKASRIGAAFATGGASEAVMASVGRHGSRSRPSRPRPVPGPTETT